jgi:cytochrome c2
MRKRTVLVLTAILGLVIMAGAFVIVGAALVVIENPTVSKVGKRAAAAYRKFSPAGKNRLEIETTLIQIAIDKTIAVPRPARGSGGGLTSLGAELVLLTNDGIIYVEKNGVLTKTAIQTPDNNYQSYASAAKPLAIQGFNVMPERLRYNDILLFHGRTNNYLLISYIEWVDAQKCYRNALARFTLPKGARSLAGVTASASDWKVIARTEPCLPIKKTFRAMEGHMSGGRMVSLDASRIAITSGDFHWDGVYAPLNVDPDSTMPLAQDPKAEYGKVLAIDVESGDKKILSSGNRNMQGIATTADGSLWTVEHGPRGGDELNLQRAGSNFGWPLQTFGTQYSRIPWPDAVPYGKHDKFTPPAFSWVPSVAVSGLTRIHDFNEAWDGDLLASSLAGQSLYRIRVMNGRGVYAERIPIGRRIRQVHQHANRQLVLWTDSYELIFLSAKSANLAYEHAWKVIDDSSLDKTKKASLKSQFTACLECHSLQFGSNERAPSLAGVWNRGIGSGQFEGYSAALKNRGGTWNEATLQAFLSDPESFAPGTIMPSQNLNDPEIVRELVNVIRSVNTTIESPGG